ncbi:MULTISPECIES: phosphate ABC transporter substrate-binding protein PstS [unclassified Nocardioides]|uniref:phosphate ABC transporter substrate-binding protein PstS n=1 Tax=unclassified Nocardioides TaxID=2615069 RepID=UPI002666949C|nr:phosphate ABC transporter substrate-binding protein PstS [Nocardioides sp. Arc9.136]WKN49637.1 phosphate ABC transporter substrate-binding protein PstS [Nocardioides sp. Arc9.136]
MKTTSVRTAVIPGLAALVLTFSACSAGNDDSGSDTGSGGSGGGESVSGQLAGGGASSQEAAQNAWIVGFQEANPDATVTYDPVGSGGGRENFISAAFPFAGSDAYLTDEEDELTDATERCGGEAPIEVPNYVSPIAMVYNVEGVDELNLSPDTIAGIFAGEITSWDAPEIAEDNPDAELPSAQINAVHRSDESGTTENFTNYLDIVAGDVWSAGAVETWPQEFGGEGAQGTSGVVSAVKSGTNSIGYADASQAGELSVANVGVGDEFVAPTAEAAASILDVSPRVEGRGEGSIVFDLDYETDEAGVYPIVLTSYLLACPSYSGDEAEAGELTKAYLTYIVSEEGQQFGADEAGSAPLSSELLTEVQGLVDGITVE